MAHPGDVLEHPRGDRLEFVATSASTGGALLEMHVTYPPRTEAPAPHLHPEQEETFTVVQGALHTVIGGIERGYAAGSSFVVPTGTPHTMRPGGPRRQRGDRTGGRPTNARHVPQ